MTIVSGTGSLLTGELTRGHLLGFLHEVSVVRMIAFGCWRRMMKMKMRM